MSQTYIPYILDKNKYIELDLNIDIINKLKKYQFLYLIKIINTKELCECIFNELKICSWNNELINIIHFIPYMNIFNERFKEILKEELKNYF